jgi:hypothetical protein
LQVGLLLALNPHMKIDPHTPAASEDLNPEFWDGRRLVISRRGLSALRDLRASLAQLAAELGRLPRASGYLLLPGCAITAARLRAEWTGFAAILLPQVACRMRLVLEGRKGLEMLPPESDAECLAWLGKFFESAPAPPERLPRADARFVITKALLLHRLRGEEPVTTKALMERTGFSYPTVAAVLGGLGNLVERTSDRRVRLRWFSREEFLRLAATAPEGRSTLRFADRSGSPRTVDAHLRRLERLSPSGVAIGGVPGARHHHPELDLVGTPRLDLSVHCPDGVLPLSFLEQLDPALERVEDPMAPAQLVVHAVRSTDPFFEPGSSGLAWADPLECLLDLHELRLDVQAAEFLAAMQRRKEPA